MLKDHITAAKTEGEGRWVTKDLLYPKGKSKLDWFKTQGWGFRDTEFLLDAETDQVGLTGSSYMFSGKMMPSFKDWALEKAGIDLNNRSLPKKLMEADPSILNEDFLEAIGENYSRISFESKERTMHSHGHTLQEIWLLRNGKFPRFVDVVIYPSTLEHVETIVKAAH